ncbi:STAS domain-containing protein [Bacillus sp. FJAT-45037]|uniref:STAS domain-containing protein n=1 Tax=Bacillus sp. FJAT-45037 TaxID=2011007 RepID=UPI000C250FF8|nr:STAS domain-containing protein [Bacillus sp. FJAT-45037]
MNLEITHKSLDNKEFVSVTGEIDAYTAPKLREALTPLAQQENKRIVVEMSNVQYIDSTGLGIFVGILKLADANGGSLVLTGVTDRVYRLFAITGLDEVIEIEQSEGEEAK